MGKITIYCGGLACEHKKEIEFDDWSGDYDIEEQQIFHPDCQLMGDFLDTVCPGCVGGFNDCDLGRAFLYQENKITAKNLQYIEQGICPYRTNGTFIMNSTSRSLEAVDLSERASFESGKFFADQIRKYIEKYHQTKEHNNG